MQRKPSKKTRGINAAEKRFMKWTKEFGICAACEEVTPCYVHHCAGSAEKIKVSGVTTLIGHWFVIPLCADCDDIITRHSRRVFREDYGRQCDLWYEHACEYYDNVPGYIIDAIALWGNNYEGL